MTESMMINTNLCLKWKEEAGRDGKLKQMKEQLGTYTALQNPGFHIDFNFFGETLDFEKPEYYSAKNAHIRTPESDQKSWIWKNRSDIFFLADVLWPFPLHAPFSILHSSSWHSSPSYKYTRNNQTSTWSSPKTSFDQIIHLLPRESQSLLPWKLQEDVPMKFQKLSIHRTWPKKITQVLRKRNPQKKNQPTPKLKNKKSWSTSEQISRNWNSSNW